MYEKREVSDAPWPPIEECSHGLEDRSEELIERSDEDAQIRFYRAMAGMAPTYQEALHKLARAVAEIVFDLCIVHLVSDDRRWVKLQAAFHPNPKTLTGIHNMYASSPQAIDEGIIGRVISTRESYFQPHWSRLRQRHDTKSEYVEATSTLKMHSVMVVPMVTTEGTVIGTLTVGRHNTKASYDERDLALLHWIASAAAMKVETVKLYRDLRATNAQLDEAVKARDAFISIASHELCTPLTVAKLTVARMQMDLTAEMPEAARTTMALGVSRIDHQVDRITGLVKRMLDVSRLSEGRLRLKYEHLDVCEVIGDAVKSMETVLEAAGCSLTLELGEPQRGHWDRTLLEHMMTNLLSNVAKYAPGAPAEITVQGSLHSVRINVRDHGPGIPLHAQLRIFERFERVVSRNKNVGLGLGLWLVRQYAESMGGIISVESEPGHGATFSLVLPRQHSASEG